MNGLHACHRAARRALAGFTIVEMIATLIIVSVLAAVGAPILASGFRNYFQAAEVATQDADARLAMERMLRDFRRIRSPADITVMTASAITFVDIDGNTVAFTISGGNLRREQNNSGNLRTLANNVTGFTLTFLGNDGQTTAASAAAVYYIAVQLTVATTGTTIPVASASYVGAVHVPSA